MAKRRKRATITITYADGSTDRITLPSSLVANVAAVIKRSRPYSRVVAETDYAAPLEITDLDAAIDHFGGGRIVGSLCTTCGYGPTAGS